MDTNNLFRENAFEVVGTLKSADIRTGNRKSDGQEYVSVDAVVESSLKGETNEFEINFFSNKLTREGKENQLFVTYNKMKNFIGKKVSISGDIRESRFKSIKTNQMVSSQKLNGRFIRSAADGTPDKATFTLGGFIVKTPVEKTDKDGNVYRYDVVLGQSNFNGDNMSMYTLHIDPSDRPIIAGVEGYEIGNTVRLNGDLNFINRVVTQESEDTSFGSGTVRTFTNRIHNYFIKGGSNPIDGDSAYSDEVIKTLINAYKARDVELAGVGDNKSAADKPIAPKPSKKQMSLI